MTDRSSEAPTSARPVTPPAGNPSTFLASLAVGGVVVAALYFARSVFVPLALALLLSFALGPVVLLLRRLHFGRTPSVLATVLLAFVVIFGIGAVIANQLTGLAENLPQYQANIKEKIESLHGAVDGGGLLQRASAALSSIRNQIVKTPVAPPSPPGTARVAVPADQPPKPALVEIRQPEQEPLQLIQTIVGPLLEPLTMAGIVVVFVIFFLLRREDLRDRFIRLAGARDMRRTTEALDDAAGRLSRYLLIQSAINACFGLLIGTGLWIIGVPNPVLWGVVAMLLRFVPYIGVVIAAACAAALAIAVAPGWSMLGWTLALFAVVEPIIGSVLEPWLYGRNTGISAVAIIVAAAFWTWLWGPIGLLLSTPLTVCLVVVGRHVDRLKFLDILLGDRPALAPEEGFYQRVLAGDPDEAAVQAEAFLKGRPLSAYYDEVAIKGLALAQLDMNRGGLDHDRRVQIKEAVDGIIDDLSDHDDTMPAVETNGDGPVEPPHPASAEDTVAPAWRETPVLCIAGRGSLDEAPAAMLAQLLGKHGIGARVTSCIAVSAANLFKLDTAGVELVVLCYLEAGGFSNARYLVRRLRRKLPHATIAIGFWTLGEDVESREEALSATGADLVVTSLRQAVDQVRSLAGEAAHRASSAASQQVAIAVKSAAE
jgi:predicted PurR-regulated permease PerM